MKLPLDFGLKLFFRLLLPGFFLTLGLLPLLLGSLDAAGLKGQREAAFVIAMIIAGWLFVAADMPVYMLLEGRRMWPGGWVTRGKEREEERLRRALAKIDDYYARGPHATDQDRRRWREASVDARKFPIDAEGNRYAEYPTRLGNTIAAFEQYSGTRYGIDSIFYWPRIWVNLNKDLREEVDSQQAMADSTVYATLGLGAAGVLWIVYGVADRIQHAAGRVLLSRDLLDAPLPEGIFAYLPGLPVCLLVGAVFLLLARGAYLLSVHVNDQFGGVFTAIIDAHAGRLATEYVAVETISSRVSRVTGAPVQDGEKMDVVRRYLQYYMARPPGEPRAVPIPKLEARLTERKAATPASAAPPSPTPTGRSKR